MLDNFDFGEIAAFEFVFDFCARRIADGHKSVAWDTESGLQGPLCRPCGQQVNLVSDDLDGHELQCMCRGATLVLVGNPVKTRTPESRESGIGTGGGDPERARRPLSRLGRTLS